MNGLCFDNRTRAMNAASLPRRGLLGLLVGSLLGGPLAPWGLTAEAKKKHRKKKRKHGGSGAPYQSWVLADGAVDFGAYHPVVFYGFLRVEVDGVPIYDGGDPEGLTDSGTALSFQAPVGAGLRLIVRRTDNGCPCASLARTDLICATTGARRTLTLPRDENLEGTCDCNNAPKSIAYDLQFTVG